ncbi:VanW family protein [Cystobacter fuscus]|uniref:VanW family protein n=1 Tax=Cystobacter fuscus TaxID=43 RepID=UPI0037BE5ADA
MSVTQSLGQSSHLEGKRHNLTVALHRLGEPCIEPGRLFSFWALVGNPSHRHGFMPGRNVVGGHLQASDGGGLCQLSGLIYLLALRAGLRIVERFPHSVDLYTEATRYTPLGADATVVYGYKDLRFLNPHSFPVALGFSLSESSLTGWVRAPVALEPCALEFTLQEEGDFRCVRTWRYPPGASAPENLGESRYRLAPA